MKSRKLKRRYIQLKLVGIRYTLVNSFMHQTIVILNPSTSKGCHHYWTMFFMLFLSYFSTCRPNTRTLWGDFRFRLKIKRAFCIYVCIHTGKCWMVESNIPTHREFLTEIEVNYFSTNKLLFPRNLLLNNTHTTDWFGCDKVTWLLQDSLFSTFSAEHLN